ncbi:MAG: AarF/ABC1/UbiB kinase family protein [Propionibacteriales bacterium]|nr:AarF/ABC1/UbiB kinase family protein [Propionibacteriales bacterium]
MTDLPRKAVARTARLASLPLGIAGRATIGLGKRLGGAPAEAVVVEMQQRTAEQLFRVLGELKGGAMKVGQAMSIFEAALPEELAGPYRATLTQLQDAAPPMSPSVVHSVLAQEMGPRWRAEFESFDDNPAASASIGQVHRAVWKDGREVAVKLQYPGAGDALRADLRQVGWAARMFAGWIPGIDLPPLVEELQARVGEELDYRLEAEAQSRFHERYAGDPDFVVPAVVAQTGTVLVGEWVESSSSLARLIAEGDQEERDRYGEMYVRFLFSGPMRAGMLHSDPHPGNYRILPDGRLGVVDYGAVARTPDGFPASMGRTLGIAVSGDYDEVERNLRAEGFIKPHIEVDTDALRDYLEPFVEPARSERFRFSRAWMRSQFSRLNDPRQPGFTTQLKLNLPPSYLLIHRVWLGGIGVLSQLEAEAPFHALLREWLPGFAEAVD